MFEHSNPSKFECLNIGMLNILMFLPFIQSSTCRAVLAKCVRIDQCIVFCIILYALEIYNLKLNHLNGVFLVEYVKMMTIMTIPMMRLADNDNYD